MSTVHESRFFLVTESNGVITLSPKGSAFLPIGGGLAICAGALFFALSRAHILDNDALDQLLVWAAAIVTPAGCLLLALGVIAAIVNRRTKTYVLDCNRGIMTRGSATYPFSRITGFRLATVPLFNRELCVLLADIDGKEVKLASDLEREPLSRVVEHLNRAVLNAAAPSRPADQGVPLPPVASAVARHSVGIFLLALGAIWSTAGYFLLQDVIITRPGVGHGPLLWPLGIWLAALGLSDFVGLPFARWVVERRSWRRYAVGAIVVGSYMVVCWR